MHASRLTRTSAAGLLGVLCVSCLSACATHFDRIQPVREAFYQGRLDAALVELEKHKDLRLRNADCKKLDRAMIALSQGRSREAEQWLREVRDEFDHLSQTSLAERAGSLLADDNVKAYHGEDYEVVLIRAFLAISNLMHDGGDASAYALQVTDKQAEIIEAVKEKRKDDPEAVLAYKQVPLGPYLRATIAEESPLQLDDAARARLQVVNWAPDFRDGRDDLERARDRVPMAPGEGALYVFTLVGRGPIKEEVCEVATQVSLLIADQIVSATSSRGVPPTIAPVKVPALRTFTSPAEGIAVDVDGQFAGCTATLVDVGAMAAAQYEAIYPRIIAEAVARRVLKKGIIYAAKEVADADPYSPASIGLSALGVAWEASESADTRCWSLLPDEIQVLRVTLPAGEHDLSLAADRKGRRLGPPATKRIPIREGRHTYVLAQFPERELIGEILVSGQE